MLYLKWHNCVRFVNSLQSNPQYFDSIISTTDILSYKSWYFNYYSSIFSCLASWRIIPKTFISFDLPWSLKHLYLSDLGQSQASQSGISLDTCYTLIISLVLVLVWSDMGGSCCITHCVWPDHWQWPPWERSAYIRLYDVQSWISNSMTQVRYIWKVICKVQERRWMRRTLLSYYYVSTFAFY